jgi:hypothetical protein
VTAYDPSEWSDLFVASAGAGAALAGLVFVAVSINIERILGLPGVPGRALETVLLLLGVVLVSVVGLIPGQGEVALGVELLVVSLGVLAVVLRQPIVLGNDGPAPAAWLWSRWTVRIVGTVPFAIGGVSVLVEGGGGLYWTAAGIALAIVGAVANAWVLLVEILR